MTNTRLISNRYMIIKHIGKGGMADVYVAIDTILKREVAIKILKDDLTHDEVALERFRREANASTCLSHPNIVDIYDVGDDGDNHYIVMEYIKGISLKELIKKRGPLPFNEAISIMKQLCSAIMEAHRNHIIHRDIKSQNVLIKADGTAKVVDFGIALASGSYSITNEDSILGSVHYMAPELAKGDIASMQTDIYSLGIVFYELLCGDVPFKGDSAVNVVLNAAKNKIPSVKAFDYKIPQAVENIILKACAKQRVNRYENVAEMLKDLNECLSQKHANDKVLIYAHNDSLSLAKDDKEKPKKSKKKKQNNIFMISMIAIVSLLSIILVIGILFLGGFLNQNKLVNVPNILNKSIIEAADILEDNGLILDMSNIKRELTDDVEVGKIIKVLPEIDSEVEVGTVVRIVVSDGIYAVMENHIGKNIDTVKSELKAKYPQLIINAIAVTSDAEPGTIVEQTSLVEGDKFDSKRHNSVTFKYSEFKSIILPHGIVGDSVDNAKVILDSLGLKYKLVPLNPNDYGLTHEDLIKLEVNSIYDMTPESGTSYSQVNDSYITLVYVTQDIIPLPEMGEDNES